MQLPRSLLQTGIRVHGRSASNNGFHISTPRPLFGNCKHEQQPSASPPQTSIANPTSQRRYTMASATTFFDFTTKDKRDQAYPLSQHKGKVVLVVNTASKCGFTPQLTSLQSLYKTLSQKYPDDFALLAWPCNQFNNQDPGSNDDIQSFCQLNYGVEFPVLGKTEVNGDKAEEVWEWMKSEKPGLMGMKRIKWNFEKFLVGRDGKVKGRWGSITKPEGLEKVIVEEIERTKDKGVEKGKSGL